MNRRKRLAVSLIGCALAAALATPTRAQSAPSPTASSKPQGSLEARKALIATGDSPDLFLLYTGDVIGYVDPCG